MRPLTEETPRKKPIPWISLFFLVFRSQFVIVFSSFLCTLARWWGGSSACGLIVLCLVFCCLCARRYVELEYFQHEVSP